MERYGGQIIQNIANSLNSSVFKQLINKPRNDQASEPPSMLITAPFT